VKALVLELVEGPTLAERIQEGPIPVEETLAIARQIAEALEAGHEAGVIHRDVKPANVKLKEDGTVKVLDYGLAKALLGDTSSGTDSELSQSPTLTRHGTQVGVILGTAAYMSPEQAKGKRVDRRTDIWAFGAVVYEMLTGKRAFPGEDVSDTLAAVLRAEPDFEALPAETPNSLRVVLRLCLSKDVTERVQSTGDVRLAMRGAFETAALPAGVVSGQFGWEPSRVVAVALASVFVGALAVGTLWWLQPPPPAPSPFRFAVTAGPGERFHEGFGGSPLAVSPDGTTLVYVSRQETGTTVLLSRKLDRIEPTPLPGTEGALTPFFSPDGRWVGFFADAKLKKVSLAGGQPTVICDAGRSSGASWGEDGSIYFGATSGTRGAGISRVSSDGGLPEELTTVDSSEWVHSSPDVVPGGRGILFDSAGPDGSNVSLLGTDTAEQRVLIEDAGQPHYLPSGHLIFARAQDLLAVAFDVDRLEVVGSPFPVVTGVFRPTVVASAQYSLSETGTLAYVPAGEIPQGSTLVWVDPDGRVTPTGIPAGIYRWPHLSPNGSKVAVATQGPGNAHIWVYDLDRGTRQRLTTEGGNVDPVWMPDGAEVVFASSRAGAWGMYAKADDGSGAARPLLPASPVGVTPYSVHPDGRRLAFTKDDPEIGHDCWVLDLEDGTASLLVETSFDERNCRFSPDGRLVSYHSFASGRSEVYVTALEAPERRTIVSTDGGTEAVWSHDGKELFYRNGQAFFTVPVASGPDIEVGASVLLFRAAFELNPGGDANYDVSPDGRFIMIQRAASATPAEIHVVVNWFEELKRLDPAKN